MPAPHDPSGHGSPRAVLAPCAPADQNGDTVTGDAAILPSLVPLPAAMAEGAGAAFPLSSGTTVAGDAEAVDALVSLLHARTGMRLERSEDGAIVLRVEKGRPPESYQIAAGEASIVVTGADAAGLFYGVQTLGQLARRERDGWAVPAVEIADAPRFAYRGVMLDVARHFLSVETVEAYIDRAATLKLNALHLHLSDDQGWRLQLDSRPLLTERSSGSSVGGDPGGYYTKDDYRRIVEHAASRHMTVVPEFDMPGHTHAITIAYPELMEEPAISDHIREIAAAYGGDLPRNGVDYDGMAVGFSSLKTRDEATYDFVADVFGELAAVTPGPYLHFGGDESLATSDDDFDVFVSRVSSIIADLGKTPVAWHEAGSAKGIADSTIGQYWGFMTPTDGMDDKARAFVANGAQLILSPADAIYLDMKPTAASELGLTWANGPTSVERSYGWEPSTIIPGITDADILGIEAPLWTETIRDLADIDRMAFPRIASAAEAAWSPSTAENEERTWESFRRRVGAMGPLWTSLGIGYLASDEIPWARGPMTTVIHSVRVVDGGRITDDAWVAFDGDRIAGTGRGDAWRPLVGERDAVVDGAGRYLTPGFIDLHGHGGAGRSYDDGAEAIRAARALHRAHGTTRAVISLVTASLDDLEERTAVVADLVQTDADVLGSHLEGPFLDIARKGAHDPALLRHPVASDLARLLAAGGGTVRQVTLAPELPGGLDAVRAVVAAGAVAAVGHTSAGREAATRAFDAGATLVTHAFNAMPGMNHREPGPVGAATADPRVTLEIIADGVHVDGEVVRIAFAAAPGRIALVTDAMAAAGAADGRYELGSLEVDVVDGVARLTIDGSIAGSTLTQDAALRNAVGYGVALPDAVEALTRTPARVLGRDDLGRLEPGCLADAVLLDADLAVVKVWVAGTEA